MIEKELEHKLVKAVRGMGGICPKFTSPGFDGMPDRLMLLPHGKLAFVEVKRHGKLPTPLQISRHKKLRELGFKVYVLDNVDSITQIIEEVMPYEVHTT